ncbi:NAD(P)H-dependent oxidoreductase [Chelativorans sp. Marseille-P2723]|uniref:NADPH-dependent FMN reductase n=1 Tax=Chelativorans sp. Marseille-P2723 TaxID=2709133 RepID=UPI00156DD327|nr:NAD(P)H-dependent oxidoreductase [Chelativorans sp. Marseille-P2723]
MSKARIGIVIGSTREGRFAEKPANWIYDLASQRDDFAVELVDLRDHPLPFFEDLASPAYGPSPNEVVRAWQEKVASLDGYIFTVAEYNRGPTAVLKNALDYAYREWNNKPAAFVGYGGTGGARAVEQLRLHAVELQMAPIRNAVHILLPDFLAVNSGEKMLSQIEHLNKSAADMLDQFAWWVRALKAARDDDGKK